MSFEMTNHHKKDLMSALKMVNDDSKAKKLVITEIKKLLYKTKPWAHFNYIANGVAYYSVQTLYGTVLFDIPVDDMGNTPFNQDMEAQLLNRWIATKQPFYSPIIDESEDFTPTPS